MPVSQHSATRTCAICERTLLMGERATRFSPHGEEGFVDVCPLCHDAAYEQGWVKEGSPTTPTVRAERRRQRLPSLGAIFGVRRPAGDTVMSEPILRRLSDQEIAIVEAADQFNASDFRRTIAGIAKSLGSPQASVVPLSGVNTEVVVTVAWEISWYQYRVALDGVQPVRLEERGYELDQVDSTFQAWNASVDEDGRVRPEIARL
jgi:hypothetical protein